MDDPVTITIDAGTSDAGGQVLRNATALSSLLTRPVIISNILAHRVPPGLKTQHRRGVLLAADITSAQVTGAENGSTHVDFRPGLIALPYIKKLDLGSAGSISLILQIVLPLLLFSTSSEGPDSGTGPPSEIATSRLTITGGTNTPKSPQVDYVQKILFPFVEEHFNTGSLRLAVKKRGYIPKGGGEVQLEVEALPKGRPLKNLQLLDRGQIISVHGVVHHPNLSDSDKANAIDCVRHKLLGLSGGDTFSAGFDPDADVKFEFEGSGSQSPGCGVVLWARGDNGSLIGGSSLGGSGVRNIGSVVEQAVDDLLHGIQNGGAVDEALQDQVIIFMALAQGPSVLNIGKAGLTTHTRTAIGVVEVITGVKFEIEGGENTVVRCEGSGYGAAAQ